MNKIIITKSRAGHYILTVRDERGMLLLTDKFVSLAAARSAAVSYRI